MKEYTARNTLKNWAKETIEILNKKDNNDFIIYKNFLIMIFSFIIFNKLLNKKFVNISKIDLTNNYLWNKLQKLFLTNSEQDFVLDSIDNIFYNSVLNFSLKFCDKHYDDLDNILAWLYQYLNINRNDNIHKDTQFFTDQYMVKYLVKESLDDFSISTKKTNYMIDPACGGGNFLIELIDVLYIKFENSDKLFLSFISKNLFGYEIDRKLSLICLININIKLLELGILKENEILKYNFNIYTDIFENRYGSLLKNDNDIDFLINVSNNKEIKYNTIFSKKYSLLITNPPFKGKREQDSDIRSYLINKYKTSKGDICLAFVERLFDLVLDFGTASFVMQNTWMYLDSYIDFRKKIINSGSILSIVDLGSDSFYDLSGEKTVISLLKYSPNKYIDNFNIYGLKNYTYNEKQNSLLQLNKNSHDLFNLKINQIKNDPYSKIEYKCFGKIKEFLNNKVKYIDFARPMQGTSTGDNKKYIKYHWQVPSYEKDWILVSKGGGYCKWSGLNIFKINWGENGENVKKNPKSVLRNTKYFNETDLVYSDTGTSGLNIRLLEDNQIFIASGPGISIKIGDKFCHLAFLNSRIASFYIKVLTPKITIAASYIGQLPVVPEILSDINLSLISKEITTLKKEYNKKRPINIEYNFEFSNSNSLYEFSINDLINDLYLELTRLKLEKESNDIIFDYFNFNFNEKRFIYSEVGYSPYDIDDNNEFNIKKIDIIINKSLDYNCLIKSFRSSKLTLGIEGILEYLAVNHGYNPLKMYGFLTENIKGLEKVILKYFMHTLHRIKLQQIKYLNKSTVQILNEELESLIQDDLKKYNFIFDFQDWQNSGIYSWHFNSFLKEPIIKLGEHNE